MNEQDRKPRQSRRKRVNPADTRVEFIEADIVLEFVSRLRTVGSRLEESLHRSSEENPSFPNGWQVASYDPNLLSSDCKHIRLRKGFKLASYQFMADGNGNGFTLAIPEDRSLPNPQGKILMGWDGPTPVFKIADTDAPDWIHQDVDAFLEGDESALSYFEASLFLRQLRELGALWHGCSWSSHEILAAPREYDPATWKWESPVPSDWRPSVRRVTSKEVEVTFLTYSGLGGQQIVRHVDTYACGYRLAPEETVIATGPGGYVY